MDILKDSHFSRMVVSDTGRRRRWPDAEKARIVEESYSAARLGSATARRHGISNQLLHAWRKAYRDGRIGGGSIGGFVPALVVPDAVVTDCSRPASRMQIVAANGRRVFVDRDVDVEALARVIRSLEGLR